MTPPPSLSGLLLIDKPPGRTSHDVVRWVRRSSGCAASATPARSTRSRRVSCRASSGRRPASSSICTAGRRPTWDRSARRGVANRRHRGARRTPPREVPTPPVAAVLAAEERLRGTYLQQPPAFSAKKIGGVRAHQLARRGFERRWPGPGDRPPPAAGPRGGRPDPLRSRGLERDLPPQPGSRPGEAARTGGHLAALRRTGIGPLRVRQALLPAWDEGCPGLADA